MNKTAKEMFEDLGYLQSKTDTRLEYQSEYEEENYVDFYYEDKTYNCGQAIDWSDEK